MNAILIAAIVGAGMGGSSTVEETEMTAELFTPRTVQFYRWNKLVTETVSCYGSFGIAKSTGKGEWVIVHLPSAAVLVPVGFSCPESAMGAAVEVQALRNDWRIAVADADEELVNKIEDIFDKYQGHDMPAGQQTVTATHYNPEPN